MTETWFYYIVCIYTLCCNFRQLIGKFLSTLIDNKDPVFCMYWEEKAAKTKTKTTTIKKNQVAYWSVWENLSRFLPHQFCWLQKLPLPKLKQNKALHKGLSKCCHLDLNIPNSRMIFSFWNADTLVLLNAFHICRNILFQNIQLCLMVLPPNNCCLHHHYFVGGNT